MSCASRRVAGVSSWQADSSGFYYSRYDAPLPGQDYTAANYYHKLFFHRLGTPQAQDALVYERPDQKEWGLDGEVSHDGRYLVIHVWQGTDVRNRMVILDLEGGAPPLELIPDLEALYRYIGSQGRIFYLRTNLDAPRNQNRNGRP